MRLLLVIGVCLGMAGCDGVVPMSNDQIISGINKCRAANLYSHPLSNYYGEIIRIQCEPLPPTWVK